MPKKPKIHNNYTLFNPYFVYRMKRFFCRQLPQSSSTTLPKLSFLATCWKRGNKPTTDGPFSTQIERAERGKGFMSDRLESTNRQLRADPNNTNFNATNIEGNEVFNSSMNTGIGVGQSRQTQLKLQHIFPAQVQKFSFIIRAGTYLLQMISIIIMVIMCNSNILPLLDITPTFSNDLPSPQLQLKNNLNKLYITICLLVRIFLIFLYLLVPFFRNPLQFFMCKIIQTVCLFLFRVPLLIGITNTTLSQTSVGINYAHLPYLLTLTLIIQFLGDLVWIMCKQQRYGYFDSRLYYTPYIIRTGILWISVVIYNILTPYAIQPSALSLFHSQAVTLIIMFVVILFQIFYMFKDKLYSLLTRNLLIIFWTILGVSVGYFCTHKILRSFDVKKNITIEQNIVTYFITLSLSVTLITIAWRSRFRISTWPLSPFSTSFQVLTKNFSALVTKQQRLSYIWSAVHLISVGYENLWMIDDTVMEINWALGRYCEDILCRNWGKGNFNSSKEQGLRDGQKEETNLKYMGVNYRNRLRIVKRKFFYDFHCRFVHHIYIILLHNFKQITEFKYLLIFFFNKKTAQKMLLFLNRSCFFDIREHQRIQNQHRSSDLASKINQMQNNEMQVNMIVKEYIRKLIKLIQIIFDSSSGICLHRCQQIGQQIMKEQEKMLRFGENGSKAGQKEQKIQIQNQSYQQKGIDFAGIKDLNPKILSEYSRKLLNLIRRQMLGVPELPKIVENVSQDEHIISQIMNQQQSLVLISAEHETVGKIIAINPSASKLTFYLQSQLIGKDINILLPEEIHSAHAAVLQTNANIEKPSDRDYVLKNLVYIIKKNKFCSLCYLAVRFIDGTMGRRWLAKLKQVENFTPFIICDGENKIIGFNQSVSRIGMGIDWMGVKLTQSFVAKLNDKNYKQDRIQNMQTITQTYQKPKAVIISYQQLLLNSNYEELVEDRIANSNKKFQNTKNVQNIKINEKDIDKDKLQTGQPQEPSTSLKIIQKNQKNQIQTMKGKKKQLPRTSLSSEQQLHKLLECSLICQVNTIANIDIIGYYIIKIIDLSEKIPKGLIIQATRQSCKSSQDKIEQNKNLEASKFKQNKNEKQNKQTQHNSQNLSNRNENYKKVHRYNSRGFRISNQLNDENTKQTEFQFSYNMKLNLIGNNPEIDLQLQSNIQFNSQASKQITEKIYSQCSSNTQQVDLIPSNNKKILNTEAKINNKNSRNVQQIIISKKGKKQKLVSSFSPQSAEHVGIPTEIPEAEQINQLIYINGELQFRENKRLEQKHQCETHPLHVYHQFHGEYTEQQLKLRHVQTKNKIYQLLKCGNPLQLVPNGTNHNLQDHNSPFVSPFPSASASPRYPSQQKTLLATLVIFLILISALFSLQVFFINESMKIWNKKIQTQLLLSDKNFKYNLVLGKIDWVLYDVIQQKINSNSSISYNVKDFAGLDSELFQLLREIQEINGKLGDIDQIQSKWLRQDYSDLMTELPKGKDLSSLSNELFITLQQLQTKTQFSSLSLPSLLTTLLSPISLLLQQITPISLYHITLCKQVYNIQLKQYQKMLYIFIIIFWVASIILGIISAFQVRSAWAKCLANLEIFAYFPQEVLEMYKSRLMKLENKIVGEADLMSEIGIQTLSIDDNSQDTEQSNKLLFHKKKISRQKSKSNKLPFLTFMFYLIIGTAFSMLFLLSINELLLFYNLQNYYYLRNVRMLDFGYTWSTAILGAGLTRIQTMKLPSNELARTISSIKLRFIDSQHILQKQYYVSRYVKYFRDANSGTLSNQFISFQEADKNFCQLSIVNQTQGTQCANSISDIQIQTIESYYQQKQYVLRSLLPIFVSNPSEGHIFPKIHNFFSNKTAFLFEYDHLQKSRYLLKFQQLRKANKIRLSFWVGGSIIALFLFIGVFLYVKSASQCRKTMVWPIVIITRCFPLIVLNRNQSFLDWFHTMRNQDYR